MKRCTRQKHYNSVTAYMEMSARIKSKGLKAENFKLIPCNKGCGCYHLFYRKPKELDKNADK